MTIGTLSTLIEIARLQSENGAHIKLSDLSSRLGVPYPTLTRQTDLLGAGVGKTPGLGFIEKAIAPTNRRERIVSLTPSGVAFLSKIDEAFTQTLPIYPAIEVAGPKKEPL